MAHREKRESEKRRKEEEKEKEKEHKDESPTSPGTERKRLTLIKKPFSLL